MDELYNQLGIEVLVTTIVGLGCLILGWLAKAISYNWKINKAKKKSKAEKEYLDKIAKTPNPFFGATGYTDTPSTPKLNAGLQIVNAVPNKVIGYGGGYISDEIKESVNSNPDLPPIPEDATKAEVIAMVQSTRSLIVDTDDNVDKLQQQVEELKVVKNFFEGYFGKLPEKANEVTKVVFARIDDKDYTLFEYMQQLQQQISKCTDFLKIVFGEHWENNDIAGVHATILKRIEALEGKISAHAHSSEDLYSVYYPVVFTNNKHEQSTSEEVFSLSGCGCEITAKTTYIHYKEKQYCSDCLKKLVKEKVKETEKKAHKRFNAQCHSVADCFGKCSSDCEYSEGFHYTGLCLRISEATTDLERLEICDKIIAELDELNQTGETNAKFGESADPENGILAGQVKTGQALMKQEIDEIVDWLVSEPFKHFEEETVNKMWNNKITTVIRSNPEMDKSSDGLKGRIHRYKSITDREMPFINAAREIKRHFEKAIEEQEEKLDLLDDKFCSPPCIECPFYDKETKTCKVSGFNILITTEEKIKLLKRYLYDEKDSQKESQHIEISKIVDVEEEKQVDRWIEIKKNGVEEIRIYVYKDDGFTETVSLRKFDKRKDEILNTHNFTLEQKAVALKVWQDWIDNEMQKLQEIFSKHKYKRSTNIYKWYPFHKTNFLGNITNLAKWSIEDTASDTTTYPHILQAKSLLKHLDECAEKEKECEEKKQQEVKIKREISMLEQKIDNLKKEL